MGECGPFGMYHRSFVPWKERKWSTHNGIEHFLGKLQIKLVSNRGLRAAFCCCFIADASAAT